jgi:NAD(P)-dependent dehydrogenase (short-subunit alcohol dehydrogenase family)
MNQPNSSSVVVAYAAVMDLQLAGKVALVTGGSRGIGRAIARGLADEGARVAICARTPANVTATAEQLSRETGAQVIGLVADTGTREAVIDLIAEVADRLGPVEILVNNAATAAGRSKPPVLDLITRDALLAEVDVKVLGYLFAAQAVAPAMRDAGWGRIINIAGLAARTTGSIIGTIRNVSVAALTKNLADELGPAGITVNCVHPGLTRTVRSTEAADDEAAALAATIEERIPRSNSIKRMIDDVDLAPLVAFLASPLSFVLNGESIEAGGGMPGTIRY